MCLGFVELGFWRLVGKCSLFRTWVMESVLHLFCLMGFANLFAFLLRVKKNKKKG